MECRITFTKRLSAWGFSLIETMIATALGSILLASICTFTINGARSFAALSNYSDLEQYSRISVDNVTRLVREMDNVTALTTNQITFIQGGTNVALSFDSTNRVLKLISGTQTTILLNDCDLCTFSAYQRNTASNTFDQFPTSPGSNVCKLVQINWTLSRKLSRGMINSETEQSSKIVIRNAR